MRKALLLFSLVVFVLFSCDTLGLLINEPTVALNKKEPIKFMGPSSSGLELDLLVKLDVTNNASFAIPRTKIGWELFIMDDTESFTVGIVEKPDNIGSGQTVTLDVPVNIGAEQLFKHIGPLINKVIAGEGIPYLIKLNIDFPIFPIPTITHEVEGEIPLSSLF